MPTQIVMDRTGDTRHVFDVKDTDALTAAEKRFIELTGAGFVAAVRTGPGTQDLVKAFDLAHEEVLFHPQLVGG